MKQSLSADQARALLDYDKDTGTLTWRVHTRNTRIGGIAGSPSSNGYVQIQVCNHNYRAHVLAWLLMTGEWPKHQIDHINGNRSDNRWANLRAATQSQNSINSPPRGPLPKGVTITPSNRFDAKLWIGGKWKCLGKFDTIEDAEIAYLRAAKEYQGEFMHPQLKERAASLCL